MKQESAPERESINKGGGLRSYNLNLYHECLRHIMLEFLELQDTNTDSNDGIHMLVSNKGHVHLYFEFFFCNRGYIWT